LIPGFGADIEPGLSHRQREQFRASTLRPPWRGSAIKPRTPSELPEVPFFYRNDRDELPISSKRNGVASMIPLKIM